jgi:hypothetical protein
MTIDPRVGFYLSIIAAVVSALVGASAQFSNLFPPEQVKQILAALTLINIVINAVNAVLHAIPSQAAVQDPNKFLLGPKRSSALSGANS